MQPVVGVGGFDFNQVRRHMTAPAITISNRETLNTAREMFQHNPAIHHLVVVDQHEQPVGILTATTTFGSSRATPD